MQEDAQLREASRGGSEAEECDAELLRRIRDRAFSGASFREIEPLVRLYRARRMQRLIVRCVAALVVFLKRSGRDGSLP